MSSISDQIQVYLFCQKYVLSPIYVLGTGDPDSPFLGLSVKTSLRSLARTDMTLLLQGFVHPLAVVVFAHRGGGVGVALVAASWTPRP